MISVDYRLVGRAFMKPWRSGIRFALQVLEWLLRASPQPASAPQEAAKISALPVEPTAAATVPEDTLSQAVAHLEYLGYEVGPDTRGWTYARHPYRYNFHLQAFAGGIRLHCVTGIGASLGNSREAWVDFLNAANDRGHVVRFSLVVDKDGVFHVRMRGLITGPYNRSVFAMVMDMWHDDLDLVRLKPEFPVESSADEREDAAAVTVN